MTHPFRPDPPATRQLIDPERDPVHLGLPQWPRRSQTEHGARLPGGPTHLWAPAKLLAGQEERISATRPERSQAAPGHPRGAQEVRHEALRVPEQGDLRSGWGPGHPKPGQVRGQRPAASRTEPGAAGLSGWNEESGPDSPA